VAQSLSGVAYIDAARTGAFQQGDPVLSGVPVTLTGTTYLGTMINPTTTTDAHGAFQFTQVPNGTYQLSFGPDPGYLGGTATAGNLSVPAGVNLISGIAVSDAQNVSAGVSFRGLDPAFVSQRMFLASTTASDFPSLAPGTGVAAASGPFLSQSGGIPAVNLSTSGSQNEDLAGFFSAPDLGTDEVAFHITDGTSTFTLNVQLFSATAPQTVANFLDYVNSGAYDNAIFTRISSLAAEGLAVLQGGGVTLQTTSDSTTLVPITITNPGVLNEFSMSNLEGTLAMALTSTNNTVNPNSATDQFFFNLVDNSTALDSQQFTVFGKVVSASDQQVLNTLATTPTHDESATPFATASSLPGVVLSTVPINPATYATNDTNFPTDTTAANYLLINNVTVVKQNEVLTYTVSSSNTSIVTAALANNTSELLTLQAGTTTGTAMITVTATDQFGNSTQTTFSVTVA
jgi:cyclophilin family peptidyl-prolyl cis-trans isomerase